MGQYSILKYWLVLHRYDMHIFIFADTDFLSIPETDLPIFNQYFSCFKNRKPGADDHLQLIALVEQPTLLLLQLTFSWFLHKK